jgi:hypothetical protein
VPPNNDSMECVPSIPEMGFAESGFDRIAEARASQGSAELRKKPGVYPLPGLRIHASEAAESPRQSNCRSQSAECKRAGGEPWARLFQLYNPFVPESIRYPCFLPIDPRGNGEAPRVALQQQATNYHPSDDSDHDHQTTTARF